MASTSVHEFNDTNFDTMVLKSPQPVLVDFWAEWCMPCRMLGPTIDSIASEFAGKVTVGKVDIDAARGLAAKYGITSIPTVIVFKNGQPVKKFVGLKKKEELADALNQAMA